jgi:mannose-6-phosphate isomerase
MTLSISECKRDFLTPCHTYLFGNLLTKWSLYGITSAQGNSAESLTQDWKPNPMGRVRLLSQCRQLYTYSHAYLITNDPKWLEIIKPLYLFIIKHYLFIDEGIERWRFSLDDKLNPLDNDSDAYALAFVLLSFSFYYKATQDSSALTHIEHTDDFLNRYMAADNGGFYEAYPINKMQQRRQNPHMHLLEGYIAAYDASGEDLYKDRIINLLTLAELHFYDENSSSLLEFFTPDWETDKEDGHRIEPGHHFEWVWLLHQAYKIHPKASYLSMASSLWKKACDYGFDSKGGIFNQIHAQSGDTLDATKRIWPITEFLKAACVQIKSEDEQAKAIHNALSFMFDHYLKADGRWHEYLDEENKIIKANLSGTTSYHIFLGLTEVLDWMQRKAP